MTTAYWCVLIAGLLPYVGHRREGGGGSATTTTRVTGGEEEGWRRRANAAQSNGFEGLPFFAAAVIVAHLAHAPQGRNHTLALGFIAARVAHFAYLADIAPLRSLVWMAGLGCTIALFFQGA